jgi:hypothetical protein
MKNNILIFFILPAFFFFFNASSSVAQIEVDTSNMGPPDNEPTEQNLKDSLSSSGDWVKITQDEIDPETIDGEDSVSIDDDIYTDYIWVPNPVLIYIGWNPYCNGRWVWTYWGWQWIPYDNWGWCTYHYGRWWWHSHYGWVWSPGRRWRHCWVSWYRSGGYWGWHPLPPRIHYKGGVSVLPSNKNVQHDGWVFVNRKDFRKPINKSNTIDVNKHTNILKGARNPWNIKQHNGYNIGTYPKVQNRNKTRTNNNWNTGEKQKRPDVNIRPDNSGKKIQVRKEHSNRTGKQHSSYNGNRSGRSNNHGSKNSTGSNSRSREKQSSNHNSGNHRGR